MNEEEIKEKEIITEELKFIIDHPEQKDRFKRHQSQNHSYFDDTAGMMSPIDFKKRLARKFDTSKNVVEKGRG